MASNTPCRACLRSLSRSINTKSSTPRRFIHLEGTSPYSPRPQRSNTPFRTFSSSTAPLYHATSILSATAKPASTTSASSASAITHPSPDRQAQAQPLPHDETRAERIVRTVRKLAPITTETYVAYGATELLFKECARHGAYEVPQARQKGGVIPTNDDGTHLGVGTGWWYEELGLPVTFNNWAHITFLHMYFLVVRFRNFPATHASVWYQHLVNHAFYAAEDRLCVQHLITSTSIRQKFLKDLFAQWRGTLMAYDEGFVKGDAMLAAAVWRNLFSADKEVDFKRLAEIVGYMRREIMRLGLATDDQVATGGWLFGENPSAERTRVMVQSRLMKDAEGELESGRAKK